MSTGGGSKGGLSGLDTSLQQGPFQFGPSQFDTQAILDAISGNQQSTQNRYAQLGLGDSTAQQTDLSQQNLLGQAAQGQLQTSEVGQPAFNPALQSAQTNISTGEALAAQQLNQQQGSSLGGALGSVAGLAKGLL